MSRRGRAWGTLLAGCFGLRSQLPRRRAPTEEVLGAASYPGMTTYRCRTDAIPIYPGQNLNLFAADQDLPQRRGGQRAGRHQRLRARLERRGLRHPLQAEHGRDQARTASSSPRASGTCTCTTSSGSRPAAGRPSPPARRRRSRSCPRATASRSAATRTGATQLHDPQPDRDRRAPGLHHLGDRLGPETDPARTDIRPATVRWLDVAGAPQLYPVFDAERGFDPDGDGKFVFPDEVPTDPAAPGYEERAKISRLATLDRARRGRDPGLRRRPPASRRPPRRPRGRPRRARRGDRRRRRPGRGPAAVPLRRALLRARRRGELGREHGGDPARLADQAEGRRHGLDQRHLRRQEGVVVRVDGDPAARAGAARTTPRPRTRSTTRPRCGRCTTPAASSPTAACPRTSTSKAGKDLEAAGPAQAARQQGQGRRARESRSTASATRSAATRRPEASRRARCARR